MESTPTSRIPSWLFSDKIEPVDGVGWRHVPTKLLHPLEVPYQIRIQFGSVLYQTGASESMVGASIRLGQPLNVFQLTSLQAHYRFPMPAPGKGSGKKGGIIKQDYAEGLVRYFFPDSSKEDFQKMVNGIMGKNIKHLDPRVSSKHGDDIVKAFQGLDKEDQQDYVKLAAVATDELHLSKVREERRLREQDSKTVQQHVTPVVLRDLFPSVQGCRVSRHPQLKRYQAFYEGIDPETGT